MDLAGSPEGLINPGNLRAKDVPSKNQCHLSYASHYYVSSKELTKVTCTQVAATCKGSHSSKSHCCRYCTGIFLLYSLFGPGDAPWVIVPLGTSLIPSQLMVAALVCPSGEAGKICAMALSNSWRIRSSCQCSHDGSVTLA